MGFQEFPDLGRAAGHTLIPDVIAGFALWTNVLARHLAQVLTAPATDDYFDVVRLSADTKKR